MKTNKIILDVESKGSKMILAALKRKRVLYWQKAHTLIGKMQDTHKSM